MDHPRPTPPPRAAQGRGAASWIAAFLLLAAAALCLATAGFAVPLKDVFSP